MEDAQGVSKTTQARWGPWLAVVVLVGITVTLVLLDSGPSAPEKPPSGSVRLRLAITQNLEIAAATDFGQPPSTKGRLPSKLTAARLTLNVIVFGLPKTTVDSLVKEALSALLKPQPVTPKPD